MALLRRNNWNENGLVTISVDAMGGDFGPSILVPGVFGNFAPTVIDSIKVHNMMAGSDDVNIYLVSFRQRNYPGGI